MDHEESRIQVEIVKYLQSQKVFCHSVSNEAAGRTKQMMGQMVAMGLRAGVADLVVWWPDGIGYLEVKTPAGRQSQSQITFERICHENGYSYDLARSVEDVVRFLEAHRV